VARGGFTVKTKVLKYILIVAALLVALVGIFVIFGKGQGQINGAQQNAAQENKNQQNEDQQTEKEISLRFVVMGDCRGVTEGTFNTETVEKTLEAIKTLSPQPSFAVMAGDLVNCKSTYSETKDELASFKDTLTKYYPIDFFYPGFGNHEAAAGAKGEKAFGEVFSEFNAKTLEGYSRTAYYFDKDNIRFYMLNTNHPGKEHMISDNQLSWLENSSDSSVDRNFYFFHEPAYPTGAYLGSALDSNKLQRDKLWQIIDGSNNPMVFCAHEHNYTRRHIDSDFNETIDGKTFEYNKSVYQITVGTFGAPIYNIYTDTKDVDVAPIYEYNFAVVDIIGSKVKVTAYDLDGNIIDQFEQ
jgi:ABC-type nickel/cobalt efflux system permease component RcnA